MLIKPDTESSARFIAVGQHEQGEALLSELKKDDKHAYELLNSVPRCELAACFLPAGVYNFGVRTSNWIEILWEVMRRIGLRKERSFLNQLVFFVMYSVVRYRHLVVKARALQQQECSFAPTKELSTTLVRDAFLPVQHGRGSS